jgi:hypothetical protein
MASPAEEELAGQELQQSLNRLKKYLQNADTIPLEIAQALRGLLPYKLPSARSATSDEVQFHLYHETASNKFEETIETVKKAQRFPEDKDSDFDDKETYRHFIGQIKTCFDHLSPIYGSGVALNDKHFLTLASCVTWYGKVPTNITVFSYNSEKQAYINKNLVKAVRLQVAFMREGKEESEHNFALLTLKSCIPDLKGLKLPFFHDFDLPITQIKYELYGFNDVYNNRKQFMLKVDDKESSNQPFITYKCENSLPGSGGSPLFAIYEGKYYLMGLHMNGAKVDKKAVHLIPEIRDTIIQMQAASEREGIEVASLCEALPKLQKDKGKEKDESERVGELQEKKKIIEKQTDASLSAEVKTQHKEAIPSKEPGILKIEDRKDVDAYLKTVFSPNLLPVLKKNFIGFDASNTDITKAGLALIPKAFKVLRLENCHQITDDALEIIRQFEALKELNLEGCFTGIKNLKQLKEAFPVKEKPVEEKVEKSHLKPISQKEASSSSSFKTFDSGSDQEEQSQLVASMED